MSAQQRLNSQISFQFYTGSRLMQRMYRPYLDEWGITYSQYLVLECLWEEDGQTIADLSIPLDLDSGTLSPLLKRMENGGFVRRQADKTDYRRVLFFLTQRGQKLQDEAIVMDELAARKRQKLRELRQRAKKGGESPKNSGEESEN